MQNRIQEENRNLRLLHSFGVQGNKHLMRTVIAHGHIFKNAGTTFDWALEKNFGKGFYDHRDDHLMREHGASYLTQFLLDNPHIAAISSHHMCDTSTIEAIDVIPIYFLRHPIERILSVYNFERKQDSSTPGSIAAKKYNFRDYVQWRMDPMVARTIRNYQTVYLAGKHFRKPGNECTLETFNAAINKVKSCLIGLVEQFDASMVKFEDSLKKRNIDLDLSYVKKNVSSERPSTNGNQVSYIADELGDVFKEVMRQNAYDLALYQAVTEQFEKEDIQDYSNKLTDFKRRCAQLW